MLKKRHAPYQQRRRWSITDARAALADLEASGLSIAGFARRQGLEPHRLYRWQKRLAEVVPGVAAPPTPPVIEIRPRRPEPIEIVLSSGRILRVAETIDTTALERLLTVLERTGC